MNDLDGFFHRARFLMSELMSFFSSTDNFSRQKIVSEMSLWVSL